MNDEIFAINTVEVLQHFFLSILGDSFDPADIKKEKAHKKHKFDTAIYIGVYGDIEGMLLLETQQSAAKELARLISCSSGQEISLNELVKNYIGELGNIIMTKTIALCDKAFGDSYLSTPSVFIGSDIQVNLFYKISHSVVINTPFGTLRLTFAVKEG